MKRILLIDDDELGRMVLKEHLIKAGYQILEADDGIDGMNLYRQSPVDLVITDIFMPQKDGLLTITELMAEFPDVKIIAISDGGRVVKSLDYLEHAKDFGAVRVFEKSSNIKTLLAAISEVLQGEGFYPN